MFMWDRQASVTQTGRHAGLCRDLQSHPVPPDTRGPSQRGARGGKRLCDLQGHTPIHPPVCIPKHHPPSWWLLLLISPGFFFSTQRYCEVCFLVQVVRPPVEMTDTALFGERFPLFRFLIESFSSQSWQICSQGFRRNRVTLLFGVICHVAEAGQEARYSYFS